MAKDFTVGPKPHMSWPEFESAQSYIFKYLTKCMSRKHSFVLVSHMSREPRETGGTVLTVDTLGNKLSAQIIKLFDEIIITRREENRYFWSTEETNTDTKGRRLPYKSDLKPDFTQILKET